MKKLFFTASLFLSVICGANAQDFASVDFNLPIKEENSSSKTLEADGRFVNCIIGRRDKITGECNIKKLGLCDCEWFRSTRGSINYGPKAVFREIKPSDINNNKLTIEAKEFT